MHSVALYYFTFMINFSSVQFRDSEWAPFEKEVGRSVKDADVTEIIGELYFELKGSLKMFLATKHGHPLLFNDIGILAEGCIPEMKSSFLTTNDSRFARVVTRPIVHQLFTSVVRDVLQVPAVPKIVLAEKILSHILNLIVGLKHYYM